MKLVNIDIESIETRIITGYLAFFLFMYLQQVLEYLNNN